jgi:NitT/TauT family transport system substrate-binding protein
MNDKRNTRLILVVATLLIVISISWGVRDFQKIGSSITIGIASWPGFASGMVGSKHDFFKGIQIETKLLDDPTARHAAFQNGSIDIMVSSADVFAQETAQGITGEIILVTDESSGGDGIVVDTTIKSPLDLKNKKIAFARATPSHFFLYKVLKKYNLAPDDVKQSQVDDPSNAGNAFISKSVNAAVTFEPFLSQAKEKGQGQVLTTTKEYPGVIVDVLVASPKLAKDHALLKQFIEGWINSVEYIKKNPQESYSIIAKGLSMKKEEVEGAVAGLRFADKSLNSRYFSINSNQVTVKSLLEEAASFWKSQKVITKIPSFDNSVSNVSIDYFSGKKKSGQ